MVLLIIPKGFLVISLSFRGRPAMSPTIGFRSWFDSRTEFPVETEPDFGVVLNSILWIQSIDRLRGTLYSGWWHLAGIALCNFTNMCRGLALPRKQSR